MLKSLLRISVLVLLFTLLVGCSEMEELRENDYEETELVSGNIEGEVIEVEWLTEDEYVEKLLEVSAEMADEIRKFGEIFEEDFDDAADQAGIIQIILGKYSLLGPPDKFKEVHGYYLDAAERFSTSFYEIESGLREQNGDQFERGFSDLLRSQDYYNYAYAHLQALVDIPMGDGTITSKDLKNLDAHAGIDRDSVLLGISKSGLELSGKWGYENEDGSIMVAIVLDKDGTYEGYGNNKYPDRSDVMLGTWSYDYITRTMTIVHEEIFENGVPSEMARPEMVFEVQYFEKDSTVQLYDIRSMNTFRYKKTADD